MGSWRAVALLVGLVLIAPVSPGGAQNADPGVQKRPDGSLLGQLGGSALELGTHHALLIGVNDYQHTEFAPKLRTAVNDVQMLGRVLIDDYGFKNVKLVLDRQATRAGVLRANGRGYVFMIITPQTHQKDVLAEYQRILESWKWTRR